MESKKLKTLEGLLTELRNEIGSPILVIPESFCDGTTLIVYDRKGEEPVFETMAPNLVEAVKKYKDHVDGLR